ncbi:hypothetical protein [Paenibacillus taiwanensis]|uniref:hypothetical protein n=1 Tax=Paenibacillus taiwanensis TaxID=401638 RepID=UPI0012F9A420|nr:hypothetical protein [Paenibacillus taiwanensis]
MRFVKTVAAVALATTLSVLPFLTVSSSPASAQQVSKFQSDDFYAPTPIVPGKVVHIAPGNPVTNVDRSKVS